MHLQIEQKTLQVKNVNKKSNEKNLVMRFLGKTVDNFNRLHQIEIDTLKAKSFKL